MLTDVIDTAIRTTQSWSELAIPGGAGGDIRIGEVVTAGGLSTGEYALLVCLAVLLGRPEEAPFLTGRMITGWLPEFVESLP